MGSDEGWRIRHLYRSLSVSQQSTTGNSAEVFSICQTSKTETRILLANSRPIV